MLAPAGTPKPIVDKIAGEMTRAAKDPKFVERLASLGVDPIGDSPEKFAAMIAAEISRSGPKRSKIAGVKPPIGHGATQHDSANVPS